MSSNDDVTQGEARSEAVRLLREAERLLGSQPPHIGHSDTYVAMAGVWAVLGQYGVPVPKEGPTRRTLAYETPTTPWESLDGMASLRSDD